MEKLGLQNSFSEAGKERFGLVVLMQKVNRNFHGQVGKETIGDENEGLKGTHPQFFLATDRISVISFRFYAVVLLPNNFKTNLHLLEMQF